MTALGDIGHVGRLPLPTIPIQIRRSRRDGERSAGDVFAQYDCHLLDRPDPS